MTALLDVDQLRTFIAGARSPLRVKPGKAPIEQMFSGSIPRPDIRWHIQMVAMCHKEKRQAAIAAACDLS